MKLFAYVRVSSRGQALDGFGLDVQRTEIAKWAKVSRHEIVEWFEDAGVSGTRQATSRPGFAALMKALRPPLTRAAVGVVMFDVSRLARTLMVQEDALQALWDARAAVFTLTSGEILHDDDDGTRKLIRQVLGAIAEYQKTNAIVKMAKGKQVAASQGRHVNGRAAYGYRINDDGLLVVDPAEQQVIEKIMRRHFSGSSAAEIAAWLTDFTEILSPTGRDDWSQRTVARIIERN